MYFIYTEKLGFFIQKVNNKTQKIKQFILKIFEMVMVDFSL